MHMPLHMWRSEDNLGCHPSLLRKGLPQSLLHLSHSPRRSDLQNHKNKCSHTKQWAPQSEAGPTKFWNQSHLTSCGSSGEDLQIPLPLPLLLPRGKYRQYSWQGQRQNISGVQQIAWWMGMCSIKACGYCSCHYCWDAIWSDYKATAIC